MDLKGKLKERAPKCFPCKWMMEDLENNSKLTNYPGAACDGSVSFPIEGKIRHLILEGFWEPAMEPLVPEEVMKKLKSALREEEKEKLGS